MYAKLLEQNVSSSLVIAGKGSEEQALQAQAKQLGLNVIMVVSNLEDIPERSVVFAGYVRDEAKKRLIAQSQCVLFATQPDLWEEAFDIVQLESMAAGKAMVASDTAVTRYLTQSGLRALIVKPDDENEWAAQTMQLFTDNSLRHRLGNENLEAAAKFDWLPITKQYVAAYRSVLD
jgi:glycosyltransferase involved in cell wall biosynthesis